MTKPKLYYFDLGGRAEPIRICLHAAGIDFEDCRIQFQDWASSSHKSEMPLGCMPVLVMSRDDHDGGGDEQQYYCQSMALARYAAKLAGLYPNDDDPLEALVVDEIMDACNEIQNTIPTYSPEESDEQKETKRREWQANTLTKYANLMERRIQSSGGESVSRHPSVADLVVRVVVENTKKGIFFFIDKDFFDPYPGIMATYKAIAMHPKVRAYYESRAEEM